jgi:hypothetical protein
VAGRDSQAHSGMDSPLTWTPAGVSALNAPVGGAGMGRRPATPSSETDTRSRERLVPDRDGASCEGGGGRPALERGGVPLAGCPTLERDGPHSRGRSTLERGGFIPRQRRTPRAEQSSARGWLGRFSDGSWARGFVLFVCLCLFAFVFHEFKRVSPGCLGHPYGCPRQ